MRSRILVVGAGGIGCELVKSLALSSYFEITVIDFDTVSLSNLSRQFFYSETDLGTQKAVALARNASRLYPQLRITGLFLDVLSDSFSLPFVNQFTFVFSAVDNVLARSQVNQLCVFSRIPLIDVASSGKSAQSVPILVGRTACYQCSPVAPPSGPAVTCTIRSNPENFEHCAAWAFHLFDSVYSGAQSDVISIAEGRSVFEDVFIDQIVRLRSQTEMWKNKEPPEPIDIVAAPNDEAAQRSTDVWQDIESVAVFLAVSEKIVKAEVFDKDDPRHLAFVTSAANLRARAFHIDSRCSMFDTKGKVAVVEPALATTNSVISGIAVTQMQRILNGEEKVRAVWLARDAKGPLLQPTSAEAPNPNCEICGIALWEIHCDFQQIRCSEIGRVVGAKAPSIALRTRIIFDPDDDDDRLLCATSLRDGDVVRVTDLDAEDDVSVYAIVRQGEEFSGILIQPGKKRIVRGYHASDWDDSDIDVID